MILLECIKSLEVGEMNNYGKCGGNDCEYIGNGIIEKGSIWETDIWEITDDSGWYHLKENGGTSWVELRPKTAHSCFKEKETMKNE